MTEVATGYERPAIIATDIETAPSDTPGIIPIIIIIAGDLVAFAADAVQFRKASHSPGRVVKVAGPVLTVVSPKDRIAA